MRRHVRALAVAAIAAALGIVINVATDLRGNPWAWVGVIVLTVASGTVTAALEGAESSTVVTRAGRLFGTRQRTEIRGIVLQFDLEIRPDGSRVQRTTVYSEEVAMKLAEQGGDRGDPQIR
jgi:hypothetical protein